VDAVLGVFSRHGFAHAAVVAQVVPRGAAHPRLTVR
jgi:hypothetical protein